MIDLIRPIVPIEIRSSTPTPVLSNFLRYKRPALNCVLLTWNAPLLSSPLLHSPVPVCNVPHRSHPMEVAELHFLRCSALHFSFLKHRIERRYDPNSHFSRQIHFYVHFLLLLSFTIIAHLKLSGMYCLLKIFLPQWQKLPVVSQFLFFLS